MTISEARAVAAAAGSYLFAVSERGANAGTIMIPRRYEKGQHAGRFVVSPDKFKRNYIGVDSLDEVADYLRRGYRVRLSPIGGGAQSLFVGESVHGWR